MIANIFGLFLLIARPIKPNISAKIAITKDRLLIIGIQDPNRAIAPKIIAKIPKTLRSSFIMKPLSAFNVDQLLHIFYFCFLHTNYFQNGKSWFIYFLGSLRCQLFGNPNVAFIMFISTDFSLFSSFLTFFLRVFHKRLNSSPLMKHCKLTTDE